MLETHNKLSCNVSILNSPVLTFRVPAHLYYIYGGLSSCTAGIFTARETFLPSHEAVDKVRLSRGVKVNLTGILYICKFEVALQHNTWGRTNGPTNKEKDV